MTTTLDMEDIVETTSSRNGISIENGIIFNINFSIHPASICGTFIIVFPGIRTPKYQIFALSQPRILLDN